jgi:hypothetical protein
MTHGAIADVIVSLLLHVQGGVGLVGLFCAEDYCCMS